MSEMIRTTVSKSDLCSAGRKLESVGFIDCGKFKRKMTKQYVGRMSNPVDEGYVDPIMTAVLSQQGFDDVAIKPANLYDPIKMFDNLAGYMRNKNLVIDRNCPKYKAAFDFAYAIFARPKGWAHLRVLKYQDIPSALKGGTSAGLPYGGRKEKFMIDGLRRMRQVLSKEKEPNPCTAYTRTSAGGKTRLVWGYPLDMTMLEAIFARPLLDRFLQMNTPMAFGRSKASVGAVVKYNIGTQSFNYSLDYSKYDQSIHRTFIVDAFNILKTWFRTEDIDSHGWSDIFNYFIYTPIVMPNGKLYRGKEHGVPSGSFFTQIIDSIVNVMLLRLVLQTQVQSRRFLVLGDDSIFGTMTPVSLQKLVDEFGNYGITLHADKSEVGTLHFLGSYWSDGLSHRPVDKILSALVCPERPRYGLYKNAVSRAARKQIALTIIQNQACAFVEGWNLLQKFYVTPEMADMRGIGKLIKYEELGGLDRFHFLNDPGYISKVARLSVGLRLLC